MNAQGNADRDGGLKTRGRGGIHVQGRQKQTSQYGHAGLWMEGGYLRTEKRIFLGRTLVRAAHWGARHYLLLRWQIATNPSASHPPCSHPTHSLHCLFAPHLLSPRPQSLLSYLLPFPQGPVLPQQKLDLSGKAHAGDHGRSEITSALCLWQGFTGSNGHKWCPEHL